MSVLRNRRRISVAGAVPVPPSFSDLRTNNGENIESQRKGQLVRKSLSDHLLASPNARHLNSGQRVEPELPTTENTEMGPQRARRSTEELVTRIRRVTQSSQMERTGTERRRK